MAENEFLTLREAATEFRVSTDTLRRRVKNGSLPHRRRLGKIVVERADVVHVLFEPAREQKSAG